MNVKVILKVELLILTNYQVFSTDKLSYLNIILNLNSYVYLRKLDFQKRQGNLHN
jgi:hypothetical protein